MSDSKFATKGNLLELAAGAKEKYEPKIEHALPVSKGGTGATTAAGAVVNVVDGQALKPASVAATGEVSGKSGTTTHELTNKAESSAVAYVEGTTATKNHASGDYFILGGVLMKATAAIATGESITTSNSTPATVQAQIDEIRDSVIQERIAIPASSNDEFLKALGAYLVEHVSNKAPFMANVARTPNWSGFAIGSVSSGRSRINFLCGVSNSTTLWYVIYNSDTDTATIKEVSMS